MSCWGLISLTMWFLITWDYMVRGKEKETKILQCRNRRERETFANHPHQCRVGRYLGSDFEALNLLFAPICSSAYISLQHVTDICHSVKSGRKKVFWAFQDTSIYLTLGLWVGNIYGCVPQENYAQTVRFLSYWHSWLCSSDQCFLTTPFREVL